MKQIDINSIREIAIKAHSDVNHLYDGEPYSVHLELVVKYCMKFIHLVPEDMRLEVIAACWLHDVIEDCRLTYNDVVKIAGKQVADLVYAVTNEKGRNREERANDKYYKGIRDVLYAAFVKLSDRCGNLEHGLKNDSNMSKGYRKENTNFLTKLFNSDLEVRYYKEFIDELNLLLS